MNATTEHLWCPLYAIGSESDDVAEIPPTVIAKLIELNAVERTASGSLQLTPYGGELFRIMESGRDVYVPSFGDPALAR